VEVAGPVGDWWVRGGGDPEEGVGVEIKASRLFYDSNRLTPI
jgi:hypothetical protein